MALVYISHKNFIIPGENDRKKTQLRSSVERTVNFHRNVPALVSTNQDPVTRRRPCQTEGHRDAFHRLEDHFERWGKG